MTRQWLRRSSFLWLSLETSIAQFSPKQRHIVEPKNEESDIFCLIHNCFAIQVMPIGVEKSVYEPDDDGELELCVDITNYLFEASDSDIAIA